MQSVLNLASLLRPASVAVIGASESPGKLGYHTLENLKNGGFTGEIYPVNPRRSGSEGTSFASVRDIGRQIDCAFIVVPADKAMEALSECADSGVKSVVIGASGFAESGHADAVSAQARIGQIARASGMRVLGPNTNGLINTAWNLYLGFNSEHGVQQKKGSIAVVSHSGALLGGISATLRTLDGGLSSFVAVGNEADLSMLDVLDYLLEDDETRVIGLVLEGLSDGDRFVEIARKAHRLDKRLVALKVGRSSAGAHAALAHSSRLSGSARAYDALLAGCGIASVRSVESLTGACVTLAGMYEPDRPKRTRPPDFRLTCVSTSGAGGALLADFAEERGLPVACGGRGTWEPDIEAKLRAIPSSGAIAHPLDVGTLKGNWGAADDVLRVLETHGRGGPLVTYVHNGPTGKRDDDLVGALAARRTRTDAPVIIVAPGGLDEKLSAKYRAIHVPVFRDITSCFESLAAYPATSGFWMAERASMAAMPAGIETGRPQQARFLSELESSELLRAAGIPLVASTIVKDLAGVERFFAANGGAAVMKALPVGVAHKNDAGLVLTSILSKGAAVEAYVLLQERLTSGGFDRNSTILMQPMVKSKVELIVGVSSEPGLGHFLVVGLGGVYTEVLNEVLLMPLFTDHDRIAHAFANSRIGALLRRLDPSAVAQKSLHDILLRLRQFVADRTAEIDSIDLNPVLVTDDGCIAVDALVCLR